MNIMIWFPKEAYFTFDNRSESQSNDNAQSEKTQNPEDEHTLYYMKVDNIYSPFSPTEKSMGAEKLNPNSSARVKENLNRIKKKTNMKKHYSVEIQIRNGKVTKKLIDNQEWRSFVVLSADGLPMLHLLQIIENHYTCIECGYKAEHPSDLKSPRGEIPPDLRHLFCLPQVDTA